VELDGNVSDIYKQDTLVSYVYVPLMVCKLQILKALLQFMVGWLMSVTEFVAMLQVNP
jgi:hypothetical protein